MVEDGKLNILHIAVMTGSKSNGVVNVVPNYLKYQSEYANVALLNCYKETYVNKEATYPIYNLCEMQAFDLENLAQPFNKPDLVVFHTIYYPVFLRIYKKLLNKQIPYVIVPHSSLTENAQKKSRLKKVLGNFLLFNSFIKKAKAIQYLCEGEKEKSVKINDRYIVVGNGIEISDKKKTYKKENNQFRLIYIGRYSIEHKGLDMLVEAVKSIKNDMLHKNIKLVLYGADYRGDMQKLQQLIKDSQIEEVVEFNGPIYGEEKRTELLKSDIFIQSSRLEGQPLGVMEAISLGLPCILTPGTNLGDLVEKEKIGWCSQFCKEQLGQVILKAYEQKEKLPEMSKRAIDYSAKYFSWSFVTEQTIKKYQELVKT